MARVNNNDLSGKVGKKLVFKTYAYGTVVSRYPDMSKVKLSAKQKKANKLFAEAVAFAKKVIADPVKRKKYEARLQPGKTIYKTALADYLKKNRT